MEKKFQKVCNALDTIKNFIVAYSNFGDVHMVNYFVEDHWNKLLSEELKEDLMKMSIEELYILPGSLSHCIDESTCSSRIHSKDSVKLLPNLRVFMKEAQSCYLRSLNVLTDTNSLPSSLETFQIQDKTYDFDSMDIQSKEFMSQKKSHEVSQMSPIINQLCHFCKTNHILDIGSGKGYLSSYLSLRYGLTVIGIESSESNSSGADRRAQKYLSYWSKQLNNRLSPSSADLKFKSVTSHIENESDLTLVKNGERYVITGLHACGDLSSSVVHIFSKQPNLSGLCVIGCCYHHHTESVDLQDNAGFPMSLYLKSTNTKLGRNKRMLALKAPEKVSTSIPEEMLMKSERSLFYRAILTVILKNEFHVDINRGDIQVGKTFSKSKNFIDYIRRSLRKLKLQESYLSDETITDYLTQYEKRFKEIVAFSMIRQIFAPAIEAMMVLDKLCYLIEKSSEANISDCFVSEIFDPVQSPRRYAIIAVKSP